MAKSPSPYDKPVPKGAAFTPRVTIRVSIDRGMRGSAETYLEIPFEGFVKDLFPMMRALRKMLEKLGVAAPDAPAPQAPLATTEEVVSPNPADT